MLVGLVQKIGLVQWRMLRSPQFRFVSRIARLVAVSWPYRGSILRLGRRIFSFNHMESLALYPRGGVTAWNLSWCSPSTTRVVACCEWRIMELTSTSHQCQGRGPSLTEVGTDSQMSKNREMQKGILAQVVLGRVSRPSKFLRVQNLMRSCHRVCAWACRYWKLKRSVA